MVMCTCFKSIDTIINALTGMARSFSCIRKRIDLGVERSVFFSSENPADGRHQEYVYLENIGLAIDGLVSAAGDSFYLFRHGEETDGDFEFYMEVGQRSRCSKD